jgi:hypothetical protein
MNVGFFGDSCRDIYHFGNLVAPMNGFSILSGSELLFSRIGMLGNVVDFFNLLANLYEIPIQPFVFTNQPSEKHYFVDRLSSRILFRNDPCFSKETLSPGEFSRVPEGKLAFVIDYKKGTVTFELLKSIFSHYQTVILTTKNKQTIAEVPPLLHDSSKRPLLYLILNRTESLHLSNEKEKFLALAKNCKAVLATNGKYGVDICSVIEGLFTRNPVIADPVENPLDPTCAGDIFLAAFGFYLNWFMDKKQPHLVLWFSIRAAMQWAGESTKHLGMWLPSVEEAKNFIRKRKLF